MSIKNSEKSTLLVYNTDEEEKDMKEIKERLKEKQDIKYRDFTIKLIPGLAEERFIGVRIPELRKLAKEIIREGKQEEFLGELPHFYQEENQLHSFILSYMKLSFEDGIEETEKFLSYIDNWAVCDSFRPDFLKRNHEKAEPYIRKWLKSEKTYTVRYAFVVLLNWYLDSEDDLKFLEDAAAVKSDEYYVNMAAAWYFSMALVKHYDMVLPYIEERRLCPEVHSRTIQKAVESLQINNERKKYLRSLK